jgi:SAM-dependent methyltransferase
MGDDAWVAGERYDPYMGRWSRAVAPLFVDWLGLPRGLRWVDVGCGTGALTSAILQRAEPKAVRGVDPAEGFVAWAGAHVVDPRASFAVGEASGLESGSSDAVVSGLVVNFLLDPAGAVAAMMTAGRGGTVAAYIWDYAGGMQMLHHFWEAAVSLDPAAGPLHEAVRFPDWNQRTLAELWRSAGAEEVETTELVAEQTYADFDELWSPFLGGTGPSPSYVAGLDPQQREALRERFSAGLPRAAGGTITLGARAYAVRGRA